MTTRPVLGITVISGSCEMLASAPRQQPDRAELRSDESVGEGYTRRADPSGRRRRLTVISTPIDLAQRGRRAGRFGCQRFFGAPLPTDGGHPARPPTVVATRRKLGPHVRHGRTPTVGWRCLPRCCSSDLMLLVRYGLHSAKVPVVAGILDLLRDRRSDDERHYASGATRGRLCKRRVGWRSAVTSMT